MKVFEDSAENALRYAYRLLGFRDRSEKELFEKLIGKGFSETYARGTVERLRERGFINDEKFALALKRDAVERKFCSRPGTRDYLLRKGIPASIADRILSDDTEYAAAAARLVEKKLKLMKGLDAGTAKRKLWGLLARRGFSYDTIHETLKSFGIKEEDNETA